MRPWIVSESDAFVVLDGLFEVLRDYGFAFGLSLHMAAGTTAGHPCFLYAFRIIADERGVDDVLARSSAEFACVLFQIERHDSV